MCIIPHTPKLASYILVVQCDYRIVEKFGESLVIHQTKTIQITTYNS